MGFFDDIFDFNGDGQTDFLEEWLGYAIINDCMKQEEEEPYTLSAPAFGSHMDSNDDWVLFCEDGSDYGLYPEGYDTQEEFEDALEEARASSSGNETHIP